MLFFPLSKSIIRWVVGTGTWLKVVGRASRSGSLGREGLFFFGIVDFFLVVVKVGPAYRVVGGRVLEPSWDSSLAGLFSSLVSI